MTYVTVWNPRWGWAGNPSGTMNFCATRTGSSGQKVWRWCASSTKGSVTLGLGGLRTPTRPPHSSSSDRASLRRRSMSSSVKNSPGADDGKTGTDRGRQTQVNTDTDTDEQRHKADKKKQSH